MGNKKWLGILVLLFVMTAVSIFAQTDSGRTPKNTITVDFGPTIIGAAFGRAGDLMDEEGFSSFGFGIAAQYERQIFSRFSVAGRFAYLGTGFGIAEEDGGLSAVLNMDLSSFSLESHVRYYPFGRSFFINGMLGYGNMSADFSGAVIVNDYGINRREDVSITASRDYLKLGGKIGWRINFGKRQGGFTFEPSFGYYSGIGLGDTLGKQLLNSLDGDISDMEDLDEVFSLLENFIFIGGPRVTLSFGWRF
jgi:hypothetical protein